MVESKEEVKIDTNLYSRQIGTFGMETMGKLIKMRVLIVGMRGLGVETAKNLVLAGPGALDIYDPTVTRIEDLTSNFYLKEEHVGKVSRAEASIGQLRELNPYVKVNFLTELPMEKHLDYNVVVYTDSFNGGMDHFIAVNKLCRENRVGFIASETLGACGYTFLDYGNEFMINDADGEQCKSFIVTHISNANPAIVTVHEDKRHSYQEGDYVNFTEVEGMDAINELDHPAKIVGTTSHTFKIELDTSAMKPYERQGLVENIKVPKKVEFHSLEQSSANPAASSQYGMLETPDLRFFGRSDHLHVAIMAIHAFRKAEGRFPGNSKDDLDKTVHIAKELNAANKEKEAHFVEEIDEDVIRKAAGFSGCSISGQAAFFGGIVAQEIVKFTGKYSPLKQWLHYDIFESLPENEVNREPMNCRYDDQIRMYGREVQEKLQNINTFMVGAGALGCEYIKAFALMGLGCSANGKVHCTDNDNIEVSNLNRQFLFRQGNVGHSKSETACNIAQTMNPNLNVTSYMTRVGSDTEDVFNDQFWERLDFVVNAVDNINARLYVDRKCVWYEKPLLESGTLGTKANSQMVVPHKTQCYGDSQDPPEEAIPMCTMRNFPNQIEHCIEWGRDKFNTLFVDRPSDAKSFIENSQQFIGQLKQNTTSAGAKTNLEEIRDFVDLKKTADYAGCVKFALEFFNYHFDHNIRDLLSVFPEDHLDSNGAKFWSGPKRCPKPVVFSADDELHVTFVQSTANLVAFNLNIGQEDNKAKVAEIAASIQMPEYVAKSIKVETEENKEENKEQQAAPELADDQEAVTNLMQVLSVSTQGMALDSIIPAEFEKDDDTNFHIAFINAVANLRARNYQITESNEHKTKMIAGKIIPAIATTTAMITGAVSVELYKFAQGITNIEKFKNGFINLALPLFLFSEPDEVKKNKSKEFDPIMCGPVTCVPENYTIYDKVTVDIGSLTIGEFIDYMLQNHKVEVTMIATGKVALYNMYLPGNKHEARKSRKMEELYVEISKEEFPKGRYYMVLELGGEYEGADFAMPPIKYCFMKP